MPKDTVTCKREALCQQVWPEPIRTVARQDGMSDGALAKICKRLAVPRPPRGYWGKTAAGKSVTRAPLPPLPQDAKVKREVTQWVGLAEDEGIRAEVRKALGSDGVRRCG